MFHHSVQQWNKLENWHSFFTELEKVFQSPLTHLDAKDPVKRRVKGGTNIEQAQYVIDQQRNLRRKWLFGKLSNRDIRFQIHLYKENPTFGNSLSLVIPYGIDEASNVFNQVERIFRSCNRLFDVFYAVADSQENLNSKLKDSGYGVDLQEELPGVFWLTYFSKNYVRYFGGKTRLSFISEARGQRNGGVVIKLGLSPGDYEAKRRIAIERNLGPNSFVNPKSRCEKDRGAYALTFDQLR